MIECIHYPGRFAETSIFLSSENIDEGEVPEGEVSNDETLLTEGEEAWK